MRPKRNIINAIVGLTSVFPAFAVFVIAAIFFVIYSLFKKPDKPVEEAWCAEIQYFDNNDSSIKHYYTKVLVFEDVIRSFSLPDNRIISSKDMIGDSTFSNHLIGEITIKDGRHFKITLLEFGKCDSDVKMDSLLKHADDPESSDSQ